MDEVEAGTAVAPEQAVARRAVAAIVGFWALGGVAALVSQQGPIGIGATFVGMACGFVFFYSLTEIAAAESGRRLWDYWNRRLPAAERRELRKSLLSTRRWGSIVRATGWPPKLVVAVLGSSLAFALGSLAARVIDDFG